MSSATSNIHIRTVSPNDAAALLAIYAPYVLETAITFEYEVPSTEEFTRRITHTHWKNTRTLLQKRITQFWDMPMQDRFTSVLHMTGLLKLPSM